MLDKTHVRFYTRRSIQRKLIEAGFSTIEAIAVTTPQELSSLAGIPLSTAQRIIKAAREALDIRFKTAYELKVERASVKKITTGSKNLDALLGGGVETKTITEFFGEFGTGKTQICHQLAVNVQLPQEKGGLEAKAVYIDTEGTFRWERIEAMARGVGLDPDEVMKNILYIRAINSDHQMAVVEELFSLVPKENIKLIIVDSVTGHFRAEYIGRENLAARQQKLCQHINQLQRIAAYARLARIDRRAVEEAEKRSREAARREEAIRNHIGVVAIGSDYYYQLGPGIRVELPRVNERDLANVPSSTAAGQVLKLVLPVRDVAAYGTPSLLESLREFLRFIREKS